MTLKASKFKPDVNTHVIGRITVYFKWRAHEVKGIIPSSTEGFIICHPRYFFKDMVDCISKISHLAKKSFVVKQHCNICYSGLKLDSEHPCFNCQNNIMQKSQQARKQNEMSPSSVEHSCIEKVEKPQNVLQRRDSFSSCSSDSAVYCSTRHTQISIPDEPVRLSPCENAHIDITCESKRQRHSSGSSVISIASDASCKEPQPGSGRKGILNCLSASARHGEIDATDITENGIFVSHLKKQKQTLVNILKSQQEMTHEGNISADTQKKMRQSPPPPAVRLHDLRKNIRRKACCHGDCNETHTTFIVRRYAEVHHSNITTHQNSSNTSGKRSAPSSSTSSSSLESSPNSNKKRKREIDKLFAALHEIKWAKHFSPETILQQTEARRTSCTTKVLNPSDSSSASGFPSSPQNKGRVISKSRSPTKNCIAKSKILSEKDTKSSESFSVKSRPSIHFLNAKNQQFPKVNNTSPPKATHRGSWLSTKKKASEKHTLQRKSSEVLLNEPIVSDRPDYIETYNADNKLSVVENDLDDVKGKHSPIFFKVAGSVQDSASPNSQSHVQKLENVNRIVSDSDSSPQSNILKHTSDLEYDILCADAQSTVIHAKNSTPIHVSICESEEYPFEQLNEDVNISKVESLNRDSSPFITSPAMPSTCLNFDLCEEQGTVLPELECHEVLVEDEFCDVSDVSITENSSCHNEPLKLPLLSSEVSLIKDVPFSEIPPVLEPCISLPTSQHQEPSPVSSPCAPHTSNHLSLNSTAGCDSDSERSCASSPDVLFVTPAKECTKQNTQKEDSYMELDKEEEPLITTSEFTPSSCSLKKFNCGSRLEPKACGASSSKRASRLILKKYVKNSNKKANSNHKHQDSSWNDDDGKTWRCVVVEGDQDRDSDEENQLSEFLNHKISSPVALAESVNSSGFENHNYSEDMRIQTSETNCEYQKQSVRDGTLSVHGSKSPGSVSSSSYVVHVKKVAHTSVSTPKNSHFEVAHKRHSKSGKALHMKEKTHCKKSKKMAVLGGTTNGNKNLLEEKRELPQEVIKLRMLYGFTFHYKGITVNKNDSYTQVILKLTTSRNIYLSVEALTELKDTLNNAGNDSNCQVLIINGIGNSFCSGLDLRPLMGPRKKEAAREMAMAVKEFIEALASFHKPLVSVVNGSAMGLGVTLLTYSDVVLASDTASFHMPYSQLGYMPEGAVTLTLPHVMGSTVAMDMLLRGRKISAHQAHDHGLVSEVLEAKKLPQQLVSRVRILAESPVSAMESTKSMLRWHLYGKLHVALENEVQMLPKQWLSPACQAALKKAFQSGLLAD